LSALHFSFATVCLLVSRGLGPRRGGKCACVSVHISVPVRAQLRACPCPASWRWLRSSAGFAAFGWQFTAACDPGCGAAKTPVQPMLPGPRLRPV